MESESVSLESNFDFSHGEYGMVDFFSSRYLFCEHDSLGGMVFILFKTKLLKILTFSTIGETQRERFSFS